VGEIKQKEGEGGISHRYDSNECSIEDGYLREHGYLNKNPLRCTQYKNKT
jgi:hypothetical protein